MHYLGIEIGGTKLQIGLGPGDGRLLRLVRETVDVPRGPEGIREQIAAVVPRLLDDAGIRHDQLKGVGIGFGGPVDDATGTIIKSHQIEGWDGFPLADWIGEIVHCPTVLGNDADVAGLAEALFGAGKGLSPIFYITIGSGIGGGLIIDGQIYRGCGRGAAEFGHLKVWVNEIVYYQDSLLTGVYLVTLEEVASGWSIGKRARAMLDSGAGSDSLLLKLADGQIAQVTADLVGQAAAANDLFAWTVLREPWTALSQALRQVLVLLCPRRVIIGGGVSLMGKVLFEPLRQRISTLDFAPFVGLTDVVPAALGQEVVVHGALALARRAFPS
jgi:glucokinase